MSRLRSLTTRYGWIVAVAVAVYAIPFILLAQPSRQLVATALLFALLATSWNLTLGTAGIFNFAHVAFFGIGAYAMGIATVRFSLDPWIGLLIGGLAGALAGILAYIPVIRMRGIYLGLVTFVFVQLCVFLVLALSPLTGGSSGMPGVPPLALGGLSFRDRADLGYVWFFGILVVILLFGMDRLVRSNLGRSLIALKENETLAISRGVPRIRQQLLAFIISGLVAGVAGACYASYFRVVSIELFGFGFITLLLAMIFVGGSGQIWGPLIGACVMTVANDQLSNLGAWRLIAIGAIVFLVLLVMPRGISGLLVRLGIMIRQSSARRRAEAAS